MADQVPLHLQKIFDLEIERDNLKSENEKLREEFDKIRNWCEAYPIEIFPEPPDLEKARQVLKEANISLTCISAHAMRHVTEGIKKLCLEALKQILEV